ncbi:putative teichuronic acid biosynthesis glycosyltransferase TuaG [Tepidimonas thermarum]|uniref:Putative teichuronic acid biosynthesis glycosyltransferase TuaG n=1 Tax=Tepidimonas thermarum TaxID=335431 RepID=A0A554WYT9_9BURK|nr:glycosyltransferase [Tepidimonas thermarum]TSE28750.1 putative teichuronic acid biosynthesis glycosyltransferase TuaG [Tepidimonas thermarum]
MTAAIKPGESLKYHVDHDEIAPESVLGQILALIRPGSRVLELGCATGSMTRILQERHGCRIDAVELDAMAAQQARPYCDRLLVEDLENMAWDGPFFAGETYDHVLIADVLEHLREPARVLRGVRGLVRAGGNIVVSTPNIGYAGVQAALQLGWFPYGPTGLLDEGHVHFFTRFELEALMLGCGVVPVARRAVHWGPGDSEFGAFWNQLAPQDQEHLLRAMDATVYQWVVAAELPSDAAWRRCVLFASGDAGQRRRLEQLSEQVVALQRELEVARQRLEEAAHRGQEESNRRCALERDLQAITEQRDQARSQLEAVLTSKSWRLTAPMRAARQAIANICGDGGKVFVSLRTQGVQPTVQRIARRLFQRPTASVPLVAGAVRSELLAGDWSAYRAWLDAYEALPPDGAERVASAIQSEGSWPTVGIVVPLFNPNLDWLRQAIESVRQQWYPHWHLYLVDDCSTRQRAELAAFLERLGEEDRRVRVVWRARNGHISAATNDGLALSADDWVTFLDQDDVLAPHALWCVAVAIRQHPQARIVYSDEDKIDAQGRRCEPHFKPDWNPDLLLSYNYICHLAVYRRQDVVAVGGVRQGFEGAQDYDLALRVLERCRPEEVVHVPRVLYHWRVHEGSTAHDVGVKPYALEAGRRALQEAMQRRGVSATVTVDRRSAYRVRYHMAGSPPHVTVVVPTRNGGRLLKTCIDGVIGRTHYDRYDIVIIDNGSDQAETLRLLRDYAQHPRCTVVHDPRPFNYAALHNAVVPGVKGDYVLLLNDDIEVKDADWLREMVSVAVQPGVGIVGARLLFPNDTVQHGGVLLVGGVAGHAHKHLPADHPGYMMRAHVRQTLSAVTAACLLVPKAVYQQVGGMDERLAVAFNDVAFCLAVGQAGYRIVWTPYAELYHHESATRGYEHEDPVKQRRFEAEVHYMQERWGDRLREDPAFNPNLDNMREDFALARPPRLTALF